MLLNTKSFGLSAAATAAIVYSICSLFVALVPTGTAAAFSYVLHIDLTAMARPISWGSYAVGVVAISVAIGLVFALAAGFYNRLSGQSTAPAS
jgi:hypothetical protein